MIDRLITLPQLGWNRASCSTDDREMLSVEPDDLSCVTEGFEYQETPPPTVSQSSARSR
jgi:hypothetical protein